MQPVSSAIQIDKSNAELSQGVLSPRKATEGPEEQRNDAAAGGPISQQPPPLREGGRSIDDDAVSAALGALAVDQSSIRLLG